MNRSLAFTNRSKFPAVMRHWLTVVGWFLGVGVACAQQFPYQAYVTTPQAYVRSGPGQRYYPTGKLPEGFAVEVYRHDAGGWCAIRPPQGSFSWIPSHQIRPVESGVVEIVGDRVVARVGSTLSPNRSAVQVLLPRGEHVESFALDEHDDPRWTRVAAPAGEFRWIDAESLSRQPPLEAASLPDSTATGWTRRSDQRIAESGTSAHTFGHLQPTTAVAPTDSHLDVPTTILTGNQEPIVPQDSQAIDVVVGSPAEMQLAQFESQAAIQPQPPTSLSSTQKLAHSAPISTPQPRVRFRGLTGNRGDVITSRARDVEELELRLSQAVVKPPQEWQLGPLETTAKRLLDVTRTPPLRAQLREVLQRISRFQQVQQRYADPVLPTLPTIADARHVEQQDPFAKTDPQTNYSQELTGITSDIRERVQSDLKNRPAPSNSARFPSADQPLYDAAGLLKPVVSKRKQAPQYALVDERGKVVSFVTPTPDLDLQPYVGHRIGVHGTRGFMPEYRRAHVTAGRVTPIKTTLRR